MSSSGVWHMSITTWGKGSFLTNLLFFLLPIMPKTMGSDLSIMRWKVSIFLFAREVWRACFNKNFLMSLLALKNSEIIQIFDRLRVAKMLKVHTTVRAPS